MIDKQLFGLYKIFGEGVIDGWNIKPISSSDPKSLISIALASSGLQKGISIEISEGNAIIGSLAAETTLPEILDNIPPREIVDVYAVLVGSTVRNRRIRFIWSRTTVSGNSIRIARITTGDRSVTNILQNSPFRQTISFKELIRSEIAKHKHRGSPTKIDLQKEAKGQLPGARIEDFDADKVSTGKLDAERIPILDHSDLNNTGLLSHAQLDSFARFIDSGSRRLLGEVASTNFLRMNTFLKTIFNNVDRHAVNMFSLIPGVSTNKFIDFDNSTSYIDLISRCISGKPNKKAGRNLSIIWGNNSAFGASFESENVVIGNDEVILERDQSNDEVIESFEFPGNTGSAVPGFTNQSVVIAQNIAVTSSDDASEGFQSAKFVSQQESAATFRFDFLSAKNLNDFDQIFIDAKTVAINHGEVAIKFINKNEDDTETVSSPFILLSKDEVTQGFVSKSFSIINIKRENIVAIIFESPELTGDFEFFVDKISSERVELFPASGFIKLRHSGGRSVQFSSVIYETSTPEGTSVRVRIRTANSTGLLERATFSPFLNSGDAFLFEGTDAEIEITLLSDSSRKFTPTIKKVELKFIVEGTTQGFVIDDAEEWLRGERTNIAVDESDIAIAKIKLDGDVDVDNLYFSNNNVISEIDPNNVAELGISGDGLLLSPRQALNFAVTEGERGLRSPFSVYRKIDRNFIIADTANDRVIEISPEGVFKRGVGSHNVFDEDIFFPLTSVYNPRINTLFATFSQSIKNSDIDISKMRLWIGGTPFVLNEENTLLDSNIVERVVAISLSAKLQFELQQRSDNVFIQFLAGSFAIPFGQSQSGNRLITNRGISVFIGDFAYIDGIRRPIFSNILENKNWILGNSKIFQNNLDKRLDSTDIALPTVVFTILIPTTVNPIIKVGNANEVLGDGVIVDFEWTLPNELQNITSVSTVGSVWTAEITAEFLTDNIIGEFFIPITKILKNTDGIIFQRQSINITIKIVSSSSPTGTELIREAESVVEIDMNNFSIVFSFDNIVFSDFSLGSVFELENDQLLIAGMSSLGTPFNKDNPQSTGKEETFEEEASRKLASFRGRVIVINKSSKDINFTYDSSDGLYASDAVLDEEFNYVVAESSFTSNGGRIIKIDPFGNIIFQLGGGVFSKINDVRSNIGNNIIIST